MGTIIFQEVSATRSGPTLTESFAEKRSFFFSGKSHKKVKPIILVNTVIPCKIFKQKRFHRSNYLKGFGKSRRNVIGGVHLKKSCGGQIFNFTKVKALLVVPPGI